MQHFYTPSYIKSLEGRECWGREASGTMPLEAIAVEDRCR